MKKAHGKAFLPNALRNAPLKYAPENELGVVYLFAHRAKRLGFDIEEIKPSFPDCIAFRRLGDRQKKVRIEFEFRSSNFRSHHHEPKDCECIVCWIHDWPQAPKRLEIIELRRFYDAVPRIWIQPVAQPQQDQLDKCRAIEWSVSKEAAPGDLVLMYRSQPVKAVQDIYQLRGEISHGAAVWRDGNCYYARIERLAKLPSPIFLDDFRKHRILSTASFMRRNIRGNQLVSEYWHYIYDMIVKRNPTTKKLLKRYAPDCL